MIEREIIYYVRCDGCEEIISRGFEDKQELIDFLIERGWQCKGKKWFCPDCQKEKK